MKLLIYLAGNAKSMNKSGSQSQLPISFLSFPSRHTLSLSNPLSFSSFCFHFRMAFKDYLLADNYDSNTSDCLVVEIIECIFCRRTRKRRQFYTNLEEFSGVEVLDQIGYGGFDRVFRCRDLDANRTVVVKQILMRNRYQGVPSSILREVSLLKELNHPNIVRLLNVMNRDHRYVNLVFEHLDCDLCQYIRDPRYPNDSMTRKSFLYQILSAVAYCHSHKILHRDLKPKNLLIDLSKKTIKVADFGVAREFVDPDMLYTKTIATPWYRAPEILFETGQYSTAIDLWSVGCIFGEMVIKQPIFQVFNCQDEKVIKQPIFRVFSCQDELVEIFRMLGTPTEETWPGVTKLYPHLKTYAKFNPLDLSTIFVDLDSAGLNLLSRMLCLDPNKRISAEAALKHPYFNDLKF